MTPRDKMLSIFEALAKGASFDLPDDETRGELRKLIKAMQRRSTAPQASERGLKFAAWARTLLPPDQRLTEGWQHQWGRVFDDLIRLDERTEAQIVAVWQFARSDHFFQRIVMSPLKLRERDAQKTLWFDRLAAEAKSKQQPPARKGQYEEAPKTPKVL